MKEITSKSGSYYLLASWKYDLIVVELTKIDSDFESRSNEFMTYIDKNIINFKKDLRVHFMLEEEHQDFLIFVELINSILKSSTANIHYFFRWKNESSKLLGKKVENNLGVKFLYKKVK